MTILEKIKYLHDRNIIIGDINPLNIMVSSPTDVHFVDTDSYQIEDFPCPVGTVNYTPPEIQGKDYGTFLRTMGNERFAVATLLFMIMLPGKTPYAQQGGEDPKSNIRGMDFSYPLGDKSNKKTPDGSWRFIWSHLTYKLKQAFYETFRRGGEHSTENSRISDSEWLAIFKEYLQLLDSGKFGEQDKMSEELFPTRFKKSKNSPHEKVKETRTCIVCGKSFDITCGEYEYFTKKGFDLPKRCKECREAKKQGNEGTYSFPSASYNSGSGGSSSSGGFFGGCFITAVVCGHYGKADDCEELTALRCYRDGWLRAQEGGSSLVDEYYRIGPGLAAALERSPRNGEYCEYLMEHYIAPCLAMIKAGKNEECKIRYCQMVEYLQQEMTL